MRSKKHLGILIILTLLASMAMISLPSTYAAPRARTFAFKVEPAVTSGVPVGEIFSVDVYIDAPEPIIAWTMDIKVDPDVLETEAFVPWPEPYGSIIWAVGGESGYLLYDWCGQDTPNPTWSAGVKFDEGERNVTAGTITDTVEAINGWDTMPPGLEGASGTAKKLVTFYFTSKSETAHSLIEITNAYYYTRDGSKLSPEIFIGHYNEPPNIAMVGHTAWPEHHNHPVSKFDWDITLFARIKNIGPIDTWGKVVFTIEDPDGVPVDDPETTPLYLLSGGAAQVVTVTWTVPLNAYDRYYVTAKSYVDLDGNLTTSDWIRSLDKPKTFNFNVKP